MLSDSIPPALLPPGRQAASDKPAATPAARGIGPSIARRASARRRQIRTATDLKIARAAIDIALDKGTSAVTIEEVSRVSGVAKTTIYRRYRNRDELLDGVCLTLSEEAHWPDPSDTPLTCEGVAGLIDTAIGNFEASFGARGVGLMVMSTSDFLRRVVATVLGPATRHIDEYVKRGVAAGVFRPDTDVGLIIDTVIGAITTSAALHDGLPDGWSGRLAGLLWRAVSAEPPSA